MKCFYVTFPVFILYGFHAVAQNDSAGRFNVYKSLLMETSTPALIADNGKHIVHIDTRLGVNTTNNQAFHTNYIQAGYSTQWRHHGFNVYYNSSLSDLHTTKTGGIQYAYGFGFKPNNKLLANTKVVAALGMSLTQEHTSYPNLIFYDQTSLYGFTNATGEQPIANNIRYPAFDAGILVRSARLFANMVLLNINQPENGMYQTQASRKEIRFVLNSGLKLIELYKFSAWALVDYDYQELDHLGLAVSYQNTYTLSSKLNKDGAVQLRFSYFRPRIRVFIQYENIHNPFSGYLNYGTMNMGVATALVKQ